MIRSWWSRHGGLTFEPTGECLARVLSFVRAVSVAADDRSRRMRIVCRERHFCAGRFAILPSPDIPETTLQSELEQHSERNLCFAAVPSRSGSI